MPATGADAPAASEAKIDGASFSETPGCGAPDVDPALVAVRIRVFKLTGSGSPESRIEGRRGLVEETFPAGAARSLERAGVDSSSSARAANEIAAGSNFTGGACTDLGTIAGGNGAAAADGFEAAGGLVAGLGEDFGKALLAVFFATAGLVDFTTTTGGLVTRATATTGWGAGTAGALGADFTAGGTGFGTTALVAVFASVF